MYYVYVKDKDGNHIIYGQSEDIFEANKIHQKAKEEGGMNMLPYGAIS